MATLTFAAPVDGDSASQHTEFVATAVGGDKFLVPTETKDVVLVFKNGHSSSITVSLVAQPTSLTIAGKGAGTWTRSNRTLAVAAGEIHSIILKTDELKAFLDTDKYLNLTYATGNVLLTVLGFNV